MSDSMFNYINNHCQYLQVECLIVDLEKAQNTIAILERAKEQLERTVNELKQRIDEASRHI